MSPLALRVDDNHDDKKASKAANTSTLPPGPPTLSRRFVTNFIFRSYTLSSSPCRRSFSLFSLFFLPPLLSLFFCLFFFLRTRTAVDYLINVTLTFALSLNRLIFLSRSFFDILTKLYPNQFLPAAFDATTPFLYPFSGNDASSMVVLYSN